MVFWLKQWRFHRLCHSPAKSYKGDAFLRILIQRLATLQLQRILRREEHIATQALRDHVARSCNQRQATIWVVRSQGCLLTHASVEHLERVEGRVLTQQRLPQRRLQLGQWIPPLLVTMDNGRSLLNLLKFCTIQQSLQQGCPIIKHCRNRRLAALGWQESPWDIEKMRQIDEHGPVRYRLHQSHITFQRTPNCTASERIDGMSVAHDVQDIIPVLLVLHMEASDAVDTSPRQHTAEDIDRRTLFQRTLQRLRNIIGFARQ